MPRRGRPKKLTDMAKLKFRAWQWTDLLYRLRDGSPGQLFQYVEHGPYETNRFAVVQWDEIGKPFHGKHPIRTVRRRKVRVIAYLVPVEKREKALKRFARRRGWNLWPPQPPQKKLWEQFKDAR